MRGSGGKNEEDWTERGAENFSDRIFNDKREITMAECGTNLRPTFRRSSATNARSLWMKVGKNWISEEHEMALEATLREGGRMQKQP
jgi:hypothetical protein